MARVLPSSKRAILGLRLTEKNTPTCSKACLDHGPHIHRWPDNWDLPDHLGLWACAPRKLKNILVKTGHREFSRWCSRLRIRRCRCGSMGSIPSPTWWVKDIASALAQIRSLAPGTCICHGRCWKRAKKKKTCSQNAPLQARVTTIRCSELTAQESIKASGHEYSSATG